MAKGHQQSPVAMKMSRALKAGVLGKLRTRYARHSGSGPVHGSGCIQLCGGEWSPAEVTASRTSTRSQDSSMARFTMSGLSQPPAPHQEDRRRPMSTKNRSPSVQQFFQRNDQSPGPDPNNFRSSAMTFRAAKLRAEASPGHAATH